MIKQALSERIRAAMKSGHVVEKEVLRVALGEIQTEEHRDNRELSDDECVAMIRRLVKSNEETLAATTDESKRATLQEAVAILRTVLPKTLDVAAIVAALASVTEGIRGAKAEGQAMGVAMKALKAAGAVVESKDVAEAVKQLRQGG